MCSHARELVRFQTLAQVATLAGSFVVGRKLANRLLPVRKSDLKNISKPIKFPKYSLLRVLNQIKTAWKHVHSPISSSKLRPSSCCTLRNHVCLVRDTQRMDDLGSQKFCYLQVLNLNFPPFKRVFSANAVYYTVYYSFWLVGKFFGLIWSAIAGFFGMIWAAIKGIRSSLIWCRLCVF